MTTMPLNLPNILFHFILMNEMTMLEMVTTMIQQKDKDRRHYKVGILL